LRDATLHHTMKINNDPKLRWRTVNLGTRRNTKALVFNDRADVLEKTQIVGLPLL
jgi:hypothetical protein